MPGPHRKRGKHITTMGQAHALTFSCYRRFKLLDNDQHKAILADAINNAATAKGFELVSFVFMPEHVHLIVFPISATADISALLFAIKRPSSYRIKQHMIAHADP